MGHYAQRAGYRNHHTISSRSFSTALCCLKMKGMRIERTNLFGFYVYLLQKIKKIFINILKVKKNSLPNRCTVMSDEQRKGWTEALPSLRGERWGVATIRQAWTAADTNAHQQEIMFGAPREEKHKHCLMCEDWPPGPCWWCSGHRQWDVNMGQLSYFTWAKLYIVCVHIFNQRKNTWSSLACF